MDDLHIGVTNSRGTVISYDFNGINKDIDNWQECLVVFQLNDNCWDTQWDDVLEDLVKNDSWDSVRLVEFIPTYFILYYLHVLKKILCLLYVIHKIVDCNKNIIMHDCNIKIILYLINPDWFLIDI